MSLIADQFSISVAVNMIHVNVDLSELGIALGLCASDIEDIRAYDKKEHRQRLIEKWYDRSVDQDFSRENLQRAMMMVSCRRESNDSEMNVPSTPTSPTGMIVIIIS
jgi:hypothetical protein